MRHLRFLTLGLIVLFSCSREALNEPVAGTPGELEIQLSVSDTEMDVRPAAKAVEENLPSTDDFMVELYNAKGVRIYRAPYAESAGMALKVNSGEYRLLAQCRDSAGAGFDPAVYAWYAADSTFTVLPQEKKAISATAKMMKVKVNVSYGPNIVTDYPEHYSVVKLIKGTASAAELKFSKEEKRSGYIPAGKLVYELYVVDPETQELKYFHNDTTDYKPNDFVKFSVDVVRGNGQTGNVTVTVDESVNGIEKKYEIPFDATTKAAPAISLDGFTPEKSFSFVEGLEYPGTQVNISAEGKIKAFELSSPLFAARGITSSPEETIDLASPSLDPAKAEAVRSLGFNFGRSVAGHRMSAISFESIGYRNQYNPSSEFSGTFTLKVTDGLGKTATETFSISQKPVSITFNPQQHSAFAKRIIGLSANVSDGDPAKAVLQYSLDGINWKSVNQLSSSPEKEVKYSDITGLNPDTRYKLRVIYNGNENVVSNIAELTTEAAAQVGNAGFEDWLTEQYSYKITWGGTFKYDWYRPWKAGEQDMWWAVTSRASMPSSGVGGVSNLHVKTCHTASPSIDSHSGKYSAHIYTVNIGTFNTDAADSGTPYPGEIFLGTANDSGKHSSDGHSFISRPDKISFWYKFKPSAGTSETFYALVELKAADGTSLFRKEITDGPAAEAWTLYEIPVEYSDLTKKVANAVIMFKSSSASKVDTDANSQLEINGVVDFTAHFGSSLRIDDVEFIYE